MAFFGRVFFPNSSLIELSLAAACAVALLFVSAACKSDYPASGQQRAAGEGGRPGGGEAR